MNTKSTKSTYLVTYQYNYGDPRETKVKATSRYEAANIVERRRIGNYVLDVQVLAK